MIRHLFHTMGYNAAVTTDTNLIENLSNLEQFYRLHRDVLLDLLPAALSQAGQWIVPVGFTKKQAHCYFFSG
jgi:hypothetical protein